MTARNRVLTALLQSIAGGGSMYGCLDLLPDEAAASAMRRADLQCGTTPQAGATYGLVVCDASGLGLASRVVDPQGSVLAFAPSGAHHPPTSPFELVARVRCREGEWQLLRPKPTVPVRPPPRPAVSIVVAVQDQARELARLLGTLADMRAEPSWELVVVDRGSFDATAELLRLVSGDITTLRIPRTTSLPGALYFGMRRARGELVALLDPDLVPTPRLCHALHVGAAKRRETHVFAGPVLDAHGRAAVEGGGPARILAMRRGVLEGTAHRSPVDIAKRLRTASCALLPAFAARRVRLDPLEANSTPKLPIRLAPQTVEGPPQPHADPVFAQGSQRVE